jgi:5'-methylthioinosine phosphorylase
MLGVIGGTGLYRLGESEPEPAPRQTPYGTAASPLFVSRLPGREEAVLFLARHGVDHAYAPHLVPYRANLWALREAGVDAVVAVNSVGSLRVEWGPGSLVVPDQLIDYTWGREQTFAGPGDPVRHLDFSHPYTPSLRARMLAAAEAVGAPVVDGATYGCTQGPRFETPAEIRRMQVDGCDLVGMTGMPEAILARELDLPFASICVVGNLAAGLAGPGQVLDHESVAAASEPAMAAVAAILAELG